MSRSHRPLVGRWLPDDLTPAEAHVMLHGACATLFDEDGLHHAPEGAYTGAEGGEPALRVGADPEAHGLDGRPPSARSDTTQPTLFSLPTPIPDGCQPDCALCGERITAGRGAYWSGVEDWQDEDGLWIGWCSKDCQRAWLGGER